jgi:MOSC domain-containing protein YiiM
MRALIQRINRKLRVDQEQLRTSRGWQAQAQGDYYVHGGERNTAWFLNRPDVEALGRKLGALHVYEHVVDA